MSFDSSDAVSELSKEVSVEESELSEVSSIIYEIILFLESCFYYII